MSVYFVHGLANAHLLPGAREAIDCVASSGFQPIIVSAKTNTNLRLMVEYFGFKDLPFMAIAMA